MNHLNSVNMSYKGHLMSCIRCCGIYIGMSIMALLHGIFPDWEMPKRVSLNLEGKEESTQW